MKTSTAFQHLENLTCIVNNYYECDIKSKKRDFVTLEARDMFIHIASSSKFNYPVQAIAQNLGLSKSAIIRARNRAFWLSRNDKFFKERRNCVFNAIENQIMA